MQKFNHNRERVVQVLLIFGIIFILLYNIPWVEKIDISHEGVEWQLGNPYYSENVSVEMNGKYYNYLFRDDYYKGTLVIKDHTENDIVDSTVDLQLSDSDVKIREAKPYGENNEKIASELLWNGDFDTLVFRVYDVLDLGDSSVYGTTWDGSNGMLITAPAADRDTAEAVAKKILKSTDKIWRVE